MMYPTPWRVAIKSSSPAAASFRRSRFTFTVSVFSSTKLSVYHSSSIRFSRLTTRPPLSIRQLRIRYSFFVSSTVCPL